MSAEQEQHTDINFLFDSDKNVTTIIQAHRSVLSAGSDIFKALFQDMPTDDGELNVEGVSKTVFIEFLKYFYQNDQVELSMGNVHDLFNLGLKYKVRKCIDDCTQFLIGIISVEIVCSTLQFAILYKQAKLIKECEKFIIVNTEAVLSSADFLKCDKDVLAHILKLNMLSWSEFHIFKACMAWVKFKSNQITLTRDTVDRHLGNLFYEIRYRSMAYRELCSLMNKYSQILAEDFTIISNIITQPRFQPGKFNACRRQIGWNERAIIKCDRVLDSSFEGNFDFDDTEETSFLTNQPLVLGQFTCCEFSCANVKVDVIITEIRLGGGGCSKARVLLGMPAYLQSKGTVLLRHPVLIRPGFFYTISIEKCTIAQVFYSNELKTEMTLESDISIEFHNYSSCKQTGKVIGLISSMDFNRI